MDSTVHPVVAAAMAEPGQFRRADAACKAPACAETGEPIARIDYTPAMRRLLFLIVWIGVSLPFAATADDIRLPAGLAKGHAATAVEIVDGDTLVLDNGDEVRLVGLQAPKAAARAQELQGLALGRGSESGAERIDERTPAAAAFRRAADGSARPPSGAFGRRGDRPLDSRRAARARHGAGLHLPRQTAPSIPEMMRLETGGAAGAARYLGPPVLSHP